MYRRVLEPRVDCRQKAEALGMVYHTVNNEPYWDEAACYCFTRRQIDLLDDATAELHRLCLQAVEAIIRHNWFARLRIPEWSIPYLVESWERQDPSLYGRFDLAWDGAGPPKLLEYNADTPTALLEASVVQWFWLAECFPDHDQFNSIHEKLTHFWQQYRRRQPEVYFACVADNVEDCGNVQYLMDTAVQSGINARWLTVEQIGWNRADRRFVDTAEKPIKALFKLYPWEWLLREEFGPHLPGSGLHLLEPPWKQLLSNKGILPILWQLFDGHPNLLPATFSDKPLLGDYVRKPLYSREGANIEIRRGAGVIESSGSYGHEGYIFQRYTPLPDFAGNFPVIGSWVIAGQPAGIGIREDKTEITGNNSRFIPHYFVEEH